MKPKRNTQHQYGTVMKEMILTIENYCRRNKIDHRFVGGISYGGLLNDKTSYRIDVQKKVIHLTRNNPLFLLREDGTVRDIDFIFLVTDPKKIVPLKKFVNETKWRTRLKISFTPSISFEGPVVFEDDHIPQQFLQYVTAIGFKKGQYYLVFDKIRQPIPIKSLESWSVELEDGTRYTTRSPIADYYAYQFRAPSGVKPKDVDKVARLKKLAHAVAAEGKKYSINYESKEYYGLWKRYVNSLQKSRLPSVQSKRMVLTWYWSTIGTRLAHGKGIVGKTLLALFNLITRIRQ